MPPLITALARGRIPAAKAGIIAGATRATPTPTNNVGTHALPKPSTISSNNAMALFLTTRKGVKIYRFYRILWLGVQAKKAWGMVRLLSPILRRAHSRTAEAPRAAPLAPKHTRFTVAKESTGWRPGARPGTGSHRDVRGTGHADRL